METFDTQVAGRGADDLRSVAIIRFGENGVFLRALAQARGRQGLFDRLFVL
jgi:hypothetical protein